MVGQGLTWAGSDLLTAALVSLLTDFCIIRYCTQVTQRHLNAFRNDAK